MKFEEFVSYVQEHILDGAPDLKGKAKVNVKKYMKNNGKEVTALTIFENDSNVSPTIRLEDYFRAHVRGKSIEDCIQEMLKVYNTYKIGEFDIGAYIDDFGKAGPHLIMKLLSREKNEALLEDLPHFIFGDLAVTFSVCVSDIFGRGGIAVTYAMMEDWGVREDDLLEASFANMQENDTTVIFRFDPESVLGNYGTSVSDHMPHIEKGWPYVLTSAEGIFGASAMLRLDVLQGFADKAECNIFIVPLSIDECLLVQDDGLVNTEQLERVLTEINRDVNPEEYFLSNSIYYYDRKRHVLHHSGSIAPMVLTKAGECNEAG
jgi:hypothetical protein